MLLYLWVWYGPDSIEVGSRAERSGSTHNDDAFAVCPALQLADSVLQLHHHAAWGTTRKEMNWNVMKEINGVSFTVQNHTREGIHAGGVVDGQHSDAWLLFEEINGASREGLQLLSDLLLIEAVDAGAAAPSLQQPWRQITHFLLLKLN